MKEELIKENVKLLQDDIKYSFKQTSEVIDIIYRKGVNDAESNLTSQKNDKQNDKQNDRRNTDVVVKSSKELNKKFGSKEPINDELTVEQKIKRAKRDVYYEVLKLIENKQDIMDVYLQVKENCKKYGEDGTYNEPYSRKRMNRNF